MSAPSILSRPFCRVSREAAYDIRRHAGAPNASPGTRATFPFSKIYLHQIRTQASISHAPKQISILFASSNERHRLEMTEFLSTFGVDFHVCPGLNQVDGEPFRTCRGCLHQGLDQSHQRARQSRRTLIGPAGHKRRRPVLPRALPLSSAAAPSHNPAHVQTSSDLLAGVICTGAQGVRVHQRSRRLAGRDNCTSSAWRVAKFFKMMFYPVALDHWK